MLVVLIIRHEDGLFSKINYVGITDRTRSGKKEGENREKIGRKEGEKREKIGRKY